MGEFEEFAEALLDQISVEIDEEHLEAAKNALRKACVKLPGTPSINFFKN